MTPLYLVRHGPTHAGRMIGWTDLAADLSDTAALSRLRAGLPDLPVVSSDLIRAAATADAIRGARLCLGTDARLREIHLGAWENRTWQDIDAAAPGALRQYYENPGDIAPPHGESWNTLSARVTAAINDLRAAHPTGVIIVAHMGVILSQVQRARGCSAYAALGQTIRPLSVSQISSAQQGMVCGAIDQIL